MWRRELQRRWVHEARGRDPDDPAVWREDMAQDLTNVLRMLGECAAEEGIDLDAPLPPRVPVLDAERLRRVSLGLATSLAEPPGEPDPETVAAFLELKSLALTLAMKCARIAGYLSDWGADDEQWARDGAPNLLLLERLKRQFRTGLARLPDPPPPEHAVSRALSDLDRILDPLIAEFAEPLRALMTALEARGAAPSPFIRAAAAPPASRS